MIYEFSGMISNKLVDKQIINEDDTDVYTYGFEIVISSLLILLGIISLGTIFHCLLKVIVFMVFFCSLRIQAGGYHAKTHLKCFSYFTLSCFLAILVTQILLDYDKNYIVIILILIESCIIVVTYAPVDTINKPLSNSEKVNYKRNSVITVIIQSIIILTLSTLVSSLQSYCMVAAIAIFIESVTLLPLINKQRKRG